ncbi:MAG TPA: sugar phosphate isomerase/epimerase family protein [Planctomycetaceae bacterium]|nr:sugar phosphate isomerase/epimerase family protein [Planctomycetaceae bacterium]
MTGNRLPGASLARHVSQPQSREGRARGLRDRLALHETTTYRWSLDEDAHACRAAGINGIGLWRTKLDDFGDERAADLLEELNLAPVSLGWAGGFTDPRECSFEDALADAFEALRQASLVGAKVLLIAPGARAGHTWNHAVEVVCDALRHLGDIAGIYGVHVAVQPALARFGSNCTFLDTLDRALDLLAICDHSCVGLNLDLFHLGHDPLLCARIPEFVKFVKTVQLCDAPARLNSEHDRLRPGEGALPLPEIVQSLESAGYTGFYELQIHSEQIWAGDYQPVLEQCRAQFDALADRVTLPPRVEVPAPLEIDPLLLPTFGVLFDPVSGVVI